MGTWAHRLNPGMAPVGNITPTLILACNKHTIAHASTLFLAPTLTYLLFQNPEIDKTCTHQLASPNVIHYARRCRMPTARVSRVSPAQSHWARLRNSITSDNACLPARAAEHAPRPTLSITQRCCRCGCVCLIQSPNCLSRNEAAVAGLAFAVSSVAYGFISLLFLSIVRE